MRAAVSAEAQFTTIAAVAHFEVGLGLTAEQPKRILFHLNNTAIGPAGHFLAVRAVANDDPSGVRLGLERNVATVAATVDRYGIRHLPSLLNEFVST